MKRWIINIILGMFVLVIVTTAVIWSVYKKMTYLPDWYTDASTSISPTESMADSLLLDSNLKQSEDSKDYPDTILSNSESDERLPQDSAWSAPSSNSLSASAGAHNFDPAKRNEKLDKTVDLSQNESHIPIKKKAKNSQSIGSLQSLMNFLFLLLCMMSSPGNSDLIYHRLYGVAVHPFQMTVSDWNQLSMFHAFPGTNFHLR